MESQACTFESVVLLLSADHVQYVEPSLRFIYCTPVPAAIMQMEFTSNAFFLAEVHDCTRYTALQPTAVDDKCV